MSNWIQLNPESLNQVTKEHVYGIEISIGMSPYDLPDRVRGDYRPDIERFVIEFEYLGRNAEPLHPVETDDPDIVFMLGRHSGRLHEIHVDVASARTERVNLKMLVPHVKNAFEALGERNPRRTKNFKVARDVISQNSDQLFDEPALAGD